MKSFRQNILLLCASVIVVLGAGVASAAEPRLVGSYDDWLAYVYSEGGKKVCYMASKPVKTEGKHPKRGEIFALVTHRPSEGTRDVFSYIAGYTYKQGSEAVLSIDDQVFNLFTSADTAWTPDADTDGKLADALKKGSGLVIKGVSDKDVKTTDTFSLEGSSKAYEKISSECRR